MGLSIRAYARQRGVSDAAVRKAIKTGRISAESDGTIDPARADRDWQRNTDSAQQRAPPIPTPHTPPPAYPREPLSDAAAPNGATFQQARTANEVLKAQTNKVRLARLKGEVVDRAQALAHVFTLARAERDAWLNWPARIAGPLAAELGVDAHTLHVTLEREIRRHLEELGTIPARVD